MAGVCGRQSLWLAVAALMGMLVPGTKAWARFEPPPPCKNAFTHQQELTEGSKVAAAVYKQMPVLPESDPVSQYVDRLGKRLVAHAPGGPTAWPYSFHVVASSEINAFALPGGAMFVNLGAVQAAETESQLAGVMAHELSHVILRHSTCNITKQQKKSVWYGLGEIASQVILGGTAGDLAAGAINFGAGVDFLHMSRQDEEQADLLGTDILYDSGFDPRGLAQFFEIIEAKYGAGGAQFLSDHPNPGNRMRYVMAEVDTLPRRSNVEVTSPEFDRIHRIALGEKVFSSDQISKGAWKGGDYITGPGVKPGGEVAADRATPATKSTPAKLLDRLALGLDAGMATFHGPGYALDVPGNWKTVTADDGSVTVAPDGGTGDFGISYGVLIGSKTVNGGVQDDQNSVLNATADLVSQFSAKQNLQQVGSIQPRRVGAYQGASVELQGSSPIVGDGKPLVEHDWLVTVPRTDGQLQYMIFVAPERDFSTLQPAFEDMVQSFRLAM